MSDDGQDFYEDDQPVGEVIAAWNRGTKGTTAKMCAHCGRPQRGSAAVYRAGREVPLCHPDEGLDCYRLVTVYGESVGARRGAL